MIDLHYAIRSLNEGDIDSFKKVIDANLYERAVREINTRRVIVGMEFNQPLEEGKIRNALGIMRRGWLRFQRGYNQRRIPGHLKRYDMDMKDSQVEDAEDEMDYAEQRAKRHEKLTKKLMRSLKSQNRRDQREMKRNQRYRDRLAARNPNLQGVSRMDKRNKKLSARLDRHAKELENLEATKTVNLPDLKGGIDPGLLGARKAAMRYYRDHHHDDGDADY